MRNPLIDFALRLGGPWGARPRKITPEVLRRDGMRDYALAAIAFERGDYRAALAGFRQARFGMRCFVCTSFDEGRTLEKLDEPDSAIAQYEHFVNGHNTDNENREFFPRGRAAATRRDVRIKRQSTEIADCRLQIGNLQFVFQPPGASLGNPVLGKSGFTGGPLSDGAKDGGSVSGIGSLIGSTIRSSGTSILSGGRSKSSPGSGCLTSRFGGSGGFAIHASCLEV